MVALVFCSLPSYAPVNANTQGELHLGQLWQYDASLLHLARTEDCGIGRVESDEYAIVKAQVDSAAIGGRDAYDPVQTPFERMSSLRVIEILWLVAGGVDLGVDLVSATAFAGSRRF